MEKDLIQSIREIGQKLTAFENMLDNSGIKKAEDLAIFRANINEHLNQVYEKDCLQFLRNVESESVDGVVTDPPYCSGGFNESGKAGAKGQGLRSDVIKEVGWFINDRMTTAGLVWLLRNVMIELHRILKDGGSVCLFTDWRMVVHIAPALESAGFRFQNMIVWNKMAMGLGVGFRHQHEIILHFVKGTGEFYSKKMPNVLNHPRVNHTKRNHQTEKPVKLLGDLIKVITPEGGIVCDPFAGSGSTGEAAIVLGRDFLGIEKTGHYVKKGNVRIKKTKKFIQNSFFPKSDPPVVKDENKIINPDE